MLSDGYLLFCHTTIALISILAYPVMMWLIVLYIRFGCNSDYEKKVLKTLNKLNVLPLALAYSSIFNLYEFNMIIKIANIMTYLVIALYLIMYVRLLISNYLNKKNGENNKEDIS